MSPASIDFADFEGRVDAVLAAAVDRGGRRAVVRCAGRPRGRVAQASLIASARAANDETALHFSGGGGLFDDLRREFSEFVAGVWRDLSHLAVVDTTAGERVECRTPMAGPATQSAASPRAPRASGCSCTTPRCGPRWR